MTSKLLGVPILGMLAVLAGCSGRSSFVPSQALQDGPAAVHSMASERAALVQAERVLHDACGPVAPGYMRCFMHVTATSYSPVRGISPDAGGYCTVNKPPCYGPGALQSAYNVKQLVLKSGKAVTIGVVDPYGYPTAKSDVVLYRQKLGLPKLCKKCLQIENQMGGKQLPESSPSWDGEQALDLDMVSAMCPKCRILLVQAETHSSANLEQAVATALKKADIVTLSWGGNEYQASDPTYDRHPGRVITASAGDTGYGAGQPCSFAGVICVGGTSLKPSSSKRGWSEVVWNDGFGGGATSSGCSAYVPKPKWQTDKGCKMRSEADLSAEADEDTGVVVAFQGQLIGGVGGTSASSPMVAGLFGLAGNAKTATPATVWKHGGSKSFNDVTKGNNGVCPTQYGYICKARKGYDGPTGWGTPNGIGAL